jgi:CrcB protein
MNTWMLLAVGGGAGALARYAVAGWVYRRVGTAFPWGTLAVNVIGSLLLGLVVTGLASSPFQIQLGAVLATGFLGDFTTFSSFSYEGLMLARDRTFARAVAYAGGSVALSVLAFVGGLGLGTFLSADG